MVIVDSRNAVLLSVTWTNLAVCSDVTTVNGLFNKQVVIKARYPPVRARLYKWRIRVACAASVAVFTIVNITCGLIAQSFIRNPGAISFNAVVVRVSINGFLFLAHGVMLSYWIFSLNRVANARDILESRGTNLWQSWATCIFIVFIFASRTLYNVIALALPKLIPNFGYGWLNVTDQADLVDLDTGYTYAVYFAALFLWEILPTIIVIVFFRVQKPSSIQENSFDDLSYQQHYFFDNPRRYDSEEDLSTKYGSQSSISSSNRQYSGAINSPTASGEASPSPRTDQSYDPGRTRQSSVSRPYTEPAYDGT
ncbi:G protein-coupled receptor 137Ba-like isoform X2 [Watersipora subatra]|uniref:G protein-coupled receptor 137Ba-like isoform X2 n=1 Tax=Watersipora subatra TaxID=2589382 RepID=UPI00355B4B70